MMAQRITRIKFALVLAICCESVSLKVAIWCERLTQKVLCELFDTADTLQSGVHVAGVSQITKTSDTFCPRLLPCSAARHDARCRTRPSACGGALAFLVCCSSRFR